MRSDYTDLPEVDGQVSGGTEGEAVSEEGTGDSDDPFREQVDRLRSLSHLRGEKGRGCPIQPRQGGNAYTDAELTTLRYLVADEINSVRGWAYLSKQEDRRDAPARLHFLEDLLAKIDGQLKPNL